MGTNGRKPPETAELSAREERLASLLAAGWTIGAACAEAKVSERQGFEWRSGPAFKARVDCMRAEMFTQALGRLARLTTSAVDTLEELLAPDKPAAIRLGAARGILSDVMALRGSVDLEVRMKKLEGKK